MLEKKPIISTTLVLSLLYPAILGAMFYNFLPVLFSWTVIKDHPVMLLSTILLFVYFFIDYIYTITYPTYSWRATILDAIALVLIYRVEVLINPASSVSFTIKAPVYLLIVHVLFILWDLSEKAWHMLFLNIPVSILLAICVLFFRSLGFFVFCQITMCITFAAILWWLMKGQQRKA